MALIDLLSRGYFPKELPRPFVTDSFARVMTSSGSPPGDWGKTATAKTKIPLGKIERYSLARGGLLRRPLAISNPLHYYLLSREIYSNWAAITAKAGGTSIAATAPEEKASGRAIDGKHPQGDRTKLAQQTRLARRYVLKTDISRFYSSIYTHSIPWALHSKPIAKANHKFTLLGNRLDYWVRNGQDAQSIGIPIGPDTSLLLAELIMQRCDEELIKHIPGLRGHRFIDDYELSFQTRIDAENAFHVLEACLSDYELALNPKKTEVLELPLPLEAPWVTDLIAIGIRSTSRSQAIDLQTFFNKAYELHNEYPEDAVLQFALARLRNVKVDPANWDMFQRLILNCVVPEAACLPYALEQIILRTNAGAIPLRDTLEEVVNLLVRSHAPNNHTSEVANALWACLALRLHLEGDAVDVVSTCDSSVVALLALDIEHSGLSRKTFDTSTWQSHMDADALYDDLWLLAYEANVKGWLPNKSSTDHVATDPNFGYLKANGVEFYNRRLARPAVMPTLPTISTTSPSLSL